MAIKTVDWTLLATGMLTEFVPELYRQTLTQAPLLRLLKVSEGPATITFTPRFAGTEAGHYADGDTTYADAIFGYTQDAKCTLAWPNHASGFQITEPAMSQAAAAMGPSQLMDSLMDNAGETAKRLVSLLAGEAYTGNGTGNAMTGLDTLITAAGVYAALNPATPGYGAWLSYVNTTGGADRAFSVNFLDDLYYGVRDTGTEFPDMFLVGPALFKKMTQSLRPWRNDWAYVSGQQVKINVGVDALSYNDKCPIIMDPNCSTKRIYAINSNYTEFKYLPVKSASPGAVLVTGPNTVELKDDGQTAGIQQALGLMFGLEVLGATGPATKCVLKGHVQLICKKRNSAGVVKDIDPAL